jgi:N-acetylmuramoyl-L-alanine amidase
LFAFSLSKLLQMEQRTRLNGTEAALVAPSPKPANPAQAVSPQVLPVDIVIDAGHGGTDGGTSGHGILEKDGTLQISQRVAATLRQRGYKVVMTRDADVRVSKEERCALSNAVPRLAFVSVHLNHGPSARGIETYFAGTRKAAVQLIAWQQVGGKPSPNARDTRSKKLADAVHKATILRTGAADRGVREENGFQILNGTACPSVLIECGFVSHADEAAKLKDSDYQQLLADGIADGLQTFLAAQESAS